MRYNVLELLAMSNRRLANVLGSWTQEELHTFIGQLEVAIASRHQEDARPALQRVKRVAIEAANSV